MGARGMTNLTIVIYSKGTRFIHRWPDGKRPDANWLHHVVGGYVQNLMHWESFVDDDIGRVKCVAYCNEHSKIDGLPRNEVATLAWREALQRKRSEVFYGKNQYRDDRDYLAGTVVVVIGDAWFMGQAEDVGAGGPSSGNVP